MFRATFKYPIWKTRKNAENLRRRYLRSVGVIGHSVGRRRAGKRIGMGEGVRIAAVGDGGADDEVFVVVVVSVMNVEGDLVQILFEVGDCAPHGWIRGIGVWKGISIAAVKSVIRWGTLTAISAGSRLSIYRSLPSRFLTNAIFGPTPSFPIFYS